MTRRVLVIDDEPHMSRLYARLLRPHADAVVTTGGVREAWAAIQDAEGDFHAILCDLNMPHLSGVDFFEGLPERAPHLQKRVIFLTGGVFDDETQQFLDSMANPLIEKPFDIDELVALVKTVADQ